MEEKTVFGKEYTIVEKKSEEGKVACIRRKGAIWRFYPEREDCETCIFGQR